MATFVLSTNVVIDGLRKDGGAVCCCQTHAGVQQDSGIPYGSYVSIGTIDFRISTAADDASITITDESLTLIVSCVLEH